MCNSEPVVIKIFTRLYSEVKTFVFKRSWKISKNESITLNEDNDSFKSTWILSSSGEGTTRTVNDVYLDFRYQQE